MRLLFFIFFTLVVLLFFISKELLTIYSDSLSFQETIYKFWTIFYVFFIFFSLFSIYYYFTKNTFKINLNPSYLNYPRTYIHTQHQVMNKM